jgi:hypothetical protein
MPRYTGVALAFASVAPVKSTTWVVQTSDWRTLLQGVLPALCPTSQVKCGACSTILRRRAAPRCSSGPRGRGNGVGCASKHHLCRGRTSVSRSPWRPGLTFLRTVNAGTRPRAMIGSTPRFAGSGAPEPAGLRRRCVPRPPEPSSGTDQSHGLDLPAVDPAASSDGRPRGTGHFRMPRISVEARSVVEVRLGARDADASHTRASSRNAPRARASRDAAAMRRRACAPPIDARGPRPVSPDSAVNRRLSSCLGTSGRFAFTAGSDTCRPSGGNAA